MSWLTDIITSIFASRFAAFAFMLSAVTFAIFVRYGGGQPLASVDASFVPFHEAPELVAQNDIPLSRVVVGPTGTIYGVVHPRFQRPDLKLVSVNATGQYLPYPNEDWQRAVLTRPTAVTIDGRGYLWVTEDSLLGRQPARILAIDTATSREVLDQPVPRSYLPRGSQLSDVVLTADGMNLIVADSSPLRLTPGLVHLDLNTGQWSQRLYRHSSIQPQRVQAVVDGDAFASPLSLRVHREGVNALAISSSGQDVIFAAGAHEGLFSTPSDKIATPTYSSDDRKISRLATKPWTESVATDVAGNVYMADAAGGRVLRVAPNGDVLSLVPENTFLWPSGLAFGPGGQLYVTETALHLPRWRIVVSDVLDSAPLGLGQQLAAFIRGRTAQAGRVGVWRLDVGVEGVLG